MHRLKFQNFFQRIVKFTFVTVSLARQIVFSVRVIRIVLSVFKNKRTMQQTTNEPRK